MPRIKRVFTTQEERLEAIRERKKQYEKGRISLGQALEDWESQRLVCGGSHVDFALHLLALHRTCCSDFCGGRESAQQGPQEGGGEDQSLDFGVQQLGNQRLETREGHRECGEPQPLKQEPASETSSLHEDMPPEQGVLGTMAIEAAYIKEEPEEYQSLSPNEIPSPSPDTERVPHAMQTSVPGWETEGNLKPSEQQTSSRHATSSIRKEKPLHNKTGNKTGTRDLKSVLAANKITPQLAAALNIGQDTVKDTTQPVNCKLCGEEFKYRHNMRKHLLAHDEQTPYRCSMCNKYFTSQDKLTKHENELCDKLRFICGTCGKIFKKKEKLKEHELTHNKVETPKGPCICETCGKVYQTESGLVDHMYKHTGLWPHKCAVCQKGYSKITELIYHMSSHSNNRPYSCQICGKRFIRKNNLQSHQRVTHKPDRPFKCSICGKEFKTKGVVQIHEQRHSKERNHQCTVCGQAFKLNLDLKNHMMTHSGERNHQCTQCGKLFCTKHQLDKHMLTHTQQRPHKCKVCGDSFRQSGHLVTHMMRHTGEWSHKCSLCEKGFGNPGHLSKHMATKHGST